MYAIWFLRSSSGLKSSSCIKETWQRIIDGRLVNGRGSHNLFSLARKLRKIGVEYNWKSIRGVVESKLVTEHTTKWYKDDST